MATTKLDAQILHDIRTGFFNLPLEDLQACYEHYEALACSYMVTLMADKDLTISYNAVSIDNAEYFLLVAEVFRDMIKERC